MKWRDKSTRDKMQENSRREVVFANDVTEFEIGIKHGAERKRYRLSGISRILVDGDWRGEPSRRHRMLAPRVRHLAVSLYL